MQIFYSCLPHPGLRLQKFKYEGLSLLSSVENREGHRYSLLDRHGLLFLRVNGFPRQVFP